MVSLHFISVLPQVEQLVKQGDSITELPKETHLVRKDLSDPFNTYRYIDVPAHPLPTTAGKVVDNLIVDDESDDQPIAPGETATITVSYILAREDYSNLFLNINMYSPGNRYIQLTQ